MRKTNFHCCELCLHGNFTTLVSTPGTEWKKNQILPWLKYNMREAHARLEYNIREAHARVQVKQVVIFSYTINSVLYSDQN